MGFPDDNDLELTVQAAWGADLTADPTTWTWTDLSDRLMAEQVSIRRGVAVGASTSQTSLATVRLTNEDGALTPLLASSPFYPYVDAGTPMRIRLRSETSPIFVDTYSRVSASGLGFSDSGYGHTYPAGTIGDFTVNGSAAKVSIPGANVLRRASSTFTTRDADVTFDASVPSIAAGGVVAAGVHLRFVDSNNYLWPTIEFKTDGTVGYKLWTVVGGAFSSPLSEATSVTYTANVLIRCRIQLVGDRIRSKVWRAADPEPDAWFSDLRDTSHTGSGRIGLLHWTQSTNTGPFPVVVTTDNLTISQPPYDRLEGYIADVRPEFIPTPDGETWSTVAIDIAGVGSRLEKNQAPSWSPLRRSVQLATVRPVAYWPLEDAEGSTSAASAYPGGPKMTVSGPAVFGFATGIPEDIYLSRYGSKPMVSVAAGASLTAAVPQSSVSNQWSVSWVNQMYAPLVPGITEMRIVQWRTAGGTFNRWALVATATGYQVRAYNDPDGTSTNVATYVGVYYDQFNFEVEAVQNGANIDVKLRANTVEIATGSVAGTLAAIIQVAVNPDKANTTASTDPFALRFIVGHLRVFDNPAAIGIPFYYDNERGGMIVRSDQAWYKESAHRRIRRLCEEEGVPIQILGSPATTGLTPLNAQQDGSFTELLESAVESESGGILYEAGYGYRYLPRTARYNQGTSLTVDMATYARSGDTSPADVLVPTLDARAANAWTVQRTDGSEGSYAAPESYRERRGTIREEVTVDVLYDTDLDDHAAWRVHQTYNAGPNYPSLPIDLAANPDLIDEWLACDIGSRVERINQPTIAGVGAIDQVIVGVTETLGPRVWQVTATVAPASPWDVGLADVALADGTAIAAL